MPESRRGRARGRHMYGQRHYIETSYEETEEERVSGKAEGGGSGEAGEEEGEDLATPYHPCPSPPPMMSSHTVYAQEDTRRVRVETSRTEKEKRGHTALL